MKNTFKKLVLGSVLTATVSYTAVAAEIEFWTTDTQEDRIKTIQLMADTFASLSNHTVKVIPMGEDEYAAQLTKAAGANAMPSAIHAGSELLSSFGEEGIIDREATTEVVNNLGADLFYAGALKLMQAADGSYNAVPLYGWVQGLWYRADLFEEAGLNPPETWADIVAAAKHFNNPSEGFYGILIPSSMDQFAEQVFTQLALSNGAKMFDADGNLIFNSPEMVETLAFMKELSQYAPPGQQTWRARDYYIQNRMAMFPYSTFIMDDLALAEDAANSLTSDNFDDLKGAKFDSQLVEKTRMVSSITNKEPASYGQVTGLSVVKGNDAEKTEAAKEWIEFIEQDVNLITWGHVAVGGANPAQKEVASSEDYLSDPKGVFVRYGQDKIAEIIGGMEDISKFSTVDGKVFPEANLIFAKMIIPEMIQKVVLQGEDPAKAVEWANGEMQKIVDEYRAQ